METKNMVDIEDENLVEGEEINDNEIAENTEETTVEDDSLPF